MLNINVKASRISSHEFRVAISGSRPLPFIRVIVFMVYGLIPLSLGGGADVNVQMYARILAFAKHYCYRPVSSLPRFLNASSTRA
jgi:hypothetical protein